MGAAIDSVVWNNKEFINAWDHGREFQMAMNFPPNGECFNPTEAGGRDDFQDNSTHSHIQAVHAHSNQLHTEVLPAFWLPPGGQQHRVNEAANCHKGDPALNKAFTYLHSFSKTVTLQCPGVTTPCLTFNSSFTIAGDIPHYNVIQMTGPAGYAPGDFKKHLFLDPATGQLLDTQKTNTQPIVVATQDHQFAIDATNYWSVVFQHHPFPAGGMHLLKYYSFVCIGTVDDVTHCINSLRKSHDPNGLIG
nr:hypothetical protein BaRGS_026681 [Batillaria attramentaria]